MAKKVLLLSLILLAVNASFGQMARIKGNASSYAGDSLTFQTYSDLITYNEELLERVKVDAGGNFQGSLRIVEPTYVFVNLGAQRGYFFAEPGKEYTLMLPPKTPKTEEERLNPFFKEETFQIGISGCPKIDLNYLTSAFEEGFTDKYNAVAEASFKNKGKVKMDSSFYQIDTVGAMLHNPYFETYKTYRMGLMKQLVTVYKTKGIADQYFRNKPILYSNTSYMELFNNVYDRFFLFYKNPVKGGDNVGSCISDGSITRLKKLLSRDSVLKNNQLMELVMLKGIYDGFYEDIFSRKGLLTLLDSLYFTTTVPEHKVIATNIREKVIRLLPGHFPPEIKLFDMNGKLVTLDHLKGKFVYLNFCAVNSYSCQQDFALLEQLYKKYGSKVEIVSISTDPDIQDLRHFLSKKNYRWTFLHYGREPDIVNRYDVKAYPTYFLINPKGMMELSPAPSPHEKLEDTLINQLRSWDML
jgi:Thiol-disulfide isomerase and thioredoxins